MCRIKTKSQYKYPIRVYRGQMLSNDELNNLQKSLGIFISINSFFFNNS